MPPKPSQNTPPARSADRTVVDVVGAVVRDGDRVLLAQRPEGKAQAGLWEFPGGKIEPGETPEEALARECREELALEIENLTVLRSVLHRYPEKTIRLILVACSVRPGSVPVPQEHQQVMWVSLAQLPAMDLCPADRELLPALRADPRPPRRSAPGPRRSGARRFAARHLVPSAIGARPVAQYLNTPPPPPSRFRRPPALVSSRTPSSSPKFRRSGGNENNISK